MKDCLFCKIVRGEIPCHKIYEDDFCLAFLDISNDAYGHTLIIPKKHYESVRTCDNSTLARVIETIKKIGNHFCEDCGFEGYNILNNSGLAAQQSVFHLHFHLYPRKTDDGHDGCAHFSGCGENLEDVCDALAIKSEPKAVLDDKDAVILYTDGACSGNPGKGGWAAILSYQGKEKILSGGDAETTNNRMELMAVIEGLENIKADVPVQVFSDSAYVVNAFLQGWLENWQNKNWKTSSGDAVQNKDLWQRLLKQTNRLYVTFNKVKGHADNEYNNRCDEIAREEIQKL